MPKILLVDDQQHIRQLYSEELKEAGYDVITAEGCFRLLEMIEEEKPDLVILDIKMSDCDGLDILQDIRSEFHNLPVILSTVYDDYKEDIKSIAADFYVVKSSDMTELKQKIAMVLETRRSS
jgi:DNA-binding response OmpR family regulator